MEYNKISQEIIAKLQALVGAQNVLTEGEQMEIYAHDEVTDPAYHHMPEAVVFAENAQQVAAVVKLANEHHFPVVPRGAGTGLACGAVPVYGGVVLSLEKMNKILEIEALNQEKCYHYFEQWCEKHGQNINEEFAYKWIREGKNHQKLYLPFVFRFQLHRNNLQVIQNILFRFLNF